MQISSAEFSESPTVNLMINLIGLELTISWINLNPGSTSLKPSSRETGLASKSISSQNL
jgi:hypothetical protein